MEKLVWKTEKRKINDLIPFDKNPRLITDRQKNDLKISLEKFGLVEIPAIDTDNKIIAGHQRLKVLKIIGRGGEEIDVRVPNRKLTQEEFDEYNIRSNKNTGEWDWGKLGKFGKDVLKEIGFEGNDLDRIFGIKEDKFDAQKEYEKIKEPETKLGDVIVLGNHRLLCGDATKPEDLKKLMNGQLARLIFTDPPYGVNYKSPGVLSYDSLKFGGTGGKIFNDDKTDEESLQFYADVLKNLYQFSSEDATIYWWFANKNNWINRHAFGEADWHMSQIIIWLKNSMVFSRGQDYHRLYEPCMLGWKKKHTHFKNKKIRNYKDVFNLDREDFNELLDVWYEHRDLTTEYIHPTQKPVRLAERALRKNSERKDIVLDVFAGSGSTMISCEQMDRVCYLMELDPKYCDVIKIRYNKLVNKE